MTTTFVLLLRVIRKMGQSPSVCTSSESASEPGSHLHGDAVKLAKRLVDTMLVAKEQHRWEVAETAIISWADILRSTNNLPSDVVELANRINGQQQGEFFLMNERLIAYIAPRQPVDGLHRAAGRRFMAQRGNGLDVWTWGRYYSRPGRVTGGATRTAFPLTWRLESSILKRSACSALL